MLEPPLDVREDGRRALLARAVGRAVVEERADELARGRALGDARGDARQLGVARGRRTLRKE